VTKTDNRREQPKSSENTQNPTPFFTGGVPITAWCFCCRATNFNVRQKTETGQQETLVIFFIYY